MFVSRCYVGFLQIIPNGATWYVTIMAASTINSVTAFRITGTSSFAAQRVTDRTFGTFQRRKTTTFGGNNDYPFVCHSFAHQQHARGPTFAIFGQDHLNVRRHASKGTFRRVAGGTQLTTHNGGNISAHATDRIDNLRFNARTTDSRT